VPSYSFNTKYFDIIDNEHKAYWMGFLWCDGYVGKREREQPNGNIRTEYNLKFSLMKPDRDHLEKFNKDINGDYLIHIYKTNGFDKSIESFECRLFITNLYFGRLLQEKYGIIPNRFDCSKVIKLIPENLKRHFIRGILDADGSFSHYIFTDKKNGCETKKITIGFTTCENLLEFIEEYFYSKKLTNTRKYKKEKRHKEEDRDTNCRGLKFSGRVQALTLLSYLYDDSTIYLDRKYEKYLKIKKEFGD